MKSISSLTEQLHSRLAPARVWFEQREPREQFALRVLAIALLLTLLWLLLWQPLRHGHQDAVAGPKDRVVQGLQHLHRGGHGTGGLRQVPL